MTATHHVRRIHGAGGEQVFHVIGVARLGRAPDNEIVVDEDGISRRHCSFEAKDGVLLVRDLGSTNGVFVNGRRVSEAQLAPGDLVLIGRATFVAGGGEGTASAAIASTGAATIVISLPIAESDYRAHGFDAKEAEEHLAALARFMDSSQRVATAESLLEQALLAVSEPLGFGYAAVYLGSDPGADAAATRVAAGSERVAPSRTVLGRVLETGESVLATSDTDHPALVGSRSLASQPKTTILAAPVAAGGRTLGALYFAGRADRATGERELRLVSLVARSLALALEARQREERALAEVALHRPKGDEASEIVAESKAMKSALDLAERAAHADATILVRGETGTGKELVARAIHAWSTRRRGPFIAVNCGAIPASMVESELFGHEKGAFTGASEKRLGRFELADRGTLFLDEIGELPLEAQVKLLRVLEDGRFFRVGGQKQVEVDVRVVVATNRDLEAAVRDGRFRSDLLFRIRVLEVTLPPLRERREDILPIALHLLPRIAKGARRPVLTAAARDRISRYDWPGNVRELRNVLERAVILARRDELDVEDLAIAAPSVPTAGDASGSNAAKSLTEVEKEHIARVLESTAWNKVRAAEILGIGRTNLYEKIRLFDLKPPA